MTLDVWRTCLSTVSDGVFPVAAARLWNSLPSHVTATPSLCPSSAVILSHISSHFLIPLSDYYSLICTVPAHYKCWVTSCFGHHNCDYIWQRVILALTSLISFTAADPGRSRLRSSSTRAAITVRTRTSWGCRAFSVSGPSVWNNLPAELRLIDSHPLFRWRLESHLFELAFN